LSVTSLTEVAWPNAKKLKNIISIKMNFFIVKMF
jgi:hypothetical protein